jgi:hypothetical protein
MTPYQQSAIIADTISDFAACVGDDGMYANQKSVPQARLNLDEQNLKNGLGQLVLTLVKLLHELLERQAIRRIDAGSLNDDQIERVGMTLMRQAEEIDRLRVAFGLEEEDLNMDLGPLGKLL